RFASGQSVRLAAPALGPEGSSHAFPRHVPARVPGLASAAADMDIQRTGSMATACFGDGVPFLFFEVGTQGPGTAVGSNPFHVLYTDEGAVAPPLSSNEAQVRKPCARLKVRFGPNWPK